MNDHLVARLEEPNYAFHDTTVVTNCGRLCLYHKKINLSTCSAGQAVGIKAEKQLVTVT